ncbi:MAG: hypothetical protein L0Z53_25705 [Acidobacteriales bacterium]|nr:hypothetical protein [Terriglobales bacterium]
MAGSKQFRAAMLIAGMALWLPAASFAQERQAAKDPRVNPPVAAADESSSRAPVTVLSSPGPAAPAAPQPDDRPLTGVELLTLGAFNTGRTYLQPSFSFTQGSTLEGGNYNYFGNARAGLALIRSTSGSTMSLNYGSGAILNRDGTGVRMQAHSLSFSQNLMFRRWTMTIADSFSYLPASAYEFGLYQGLGQNFGGSYGALQGQFGNPSGLDPFFVPNQTVIGGGGTRHTNTIVGQMAYLVSPRVTWTAAGSFGFLRFLDPGSVESDSGAFRTGFNYALTARDTLAVMYGMNMIRFTGDRSIDNHTFHLSYGRQLTGRLSLQVSAGPDYDFLSDATLGDSSRLSWSTNTNLTYGWGYTLLGVGYSLMTTAGSGAQVGARTHWVRFSASRQLSRMWSLTGDGAFAHNRGLQQLNAASVLRRFQSWRGGVDLSRPVGRYLRMGLRYQVLREQTSCGAAAVACPGSTLRHHFGVNFDFAKQFNPIELN